LAHQIQRRKELSRKRLRWRAFWQSVGAEAELHDRYPMMIDGEMGLVMRTIGVLGGIGPQATLDFETRVHDEARRRMKPHLNEGYPPMVTVYLRHAPVLLDDDGRPRQPLALDPRVLDAAARLGTWADLIAIPSNTPHLFLKEIARASGCEVMSIVDVTVDELQRREIERVGLVGLGIPRVYEERFRLERIEIVVAPEPVRDRLDDAILRLMEGRTVERHHEAARAAISSVRDAGAAVTVLGCTEIPLLLGLEAERDDLVNPAQLLARAVVRHAVECERPDSPSRG
jgi:aspartate racemase